MIPTLTIKKLENGYIVNAEYLDKSGVRVIKNCIMQTQKELVEFLKTWVENVG